MIPYGRQDITQADIDAVTAVLRSDFLTQGPAVPAFEKAVCDLVGVKHAVAVNSATSALHIACAALGLGPGDRLWTVPNTFVASANCARYCGADVDFVDIDSATWNMSVSSLRDKLAVARRESRLPKIVVPVHFGGQATEQRAIHELAQEFGFRVIEDASHAIGASAHGEAVGNCRWSDITIFSFHPVKIVTSGEGGMSLTNDAQLADLMAMLRSHGITRDVKRMRGYQIETGGTQMQPPAWYYEQLILGFNYRITDVHAALGSSQLNRIGDYVRRRNELARRYDAALRGLPLRLPVVQPGNVSAFHLYVVRLHGAKKTHREVFDEMRLRGVAVNLHYAPVHLQPYYRELGFNDGYCPEAEAHGREAITLPLYPTLSEREQDIVITALREAL
jgi:UDP-4-amino-4,6-dideoxy-N-acetyl-beta-L-altrosamine transaminase